MADDKDDVWDEVDEVRPSDLIVYVVDNEFVVVPKRAWLIGTQHLAADLRQDLWQECEVGEVYVKMSLTTWRRLLSLVLQ